MRIEELAMRICKNALFEKRKDFCQKRSKKQLDCNKRSVLLSRNP
jgi:hypothetical protein